MAVLRETQGQEQRTPPRAATPEADEETAYLDTRAMHGNLGDRELPPRYPQSVGLTFRC